jgi:O-Antigen ligase
MDRDVSALAATTSTARGASLAASGEHGRKIVQAFAIALFVIPSNFVIRAIGAIAYPAGLIGMFAMVVWIAAVLLGHHNTRLTRHPIRGVFAVFWIVTLASYVLTDRSMLDPAQLLAGDRWLMQLAEMTGVAFLAAECLNSLDDVRRVVRVLSWASAFCGVVALLQWRFHMNFEPYLGHIPGLTDDGTEALQARDGLSRVSGTGIDPIELGVTAAMLLPLAIWAAQQTDVRTNAQRWAPVLLTALGVPASVARSAVIAAICAFGVFLVLMPPRQRVAAFTLVPIIIAGVFATSHGELGALAGSFTGASTDSSVTHRTDNYPYVEHLVSEAPWLGTGGGTYLPANPLHILDNQYLTTAIELGLLGVGALTYFFLAPLVIALKACAKSRDPSLRMLCAALAGAALAGGVCSAFFDSLSFPLFYNVYAIGLGIIGACWRLAKREPPEGQTPITQSALASRPRDLSTFRTRRFVTYTGR